MRPRRVSLLLRRPLVAASAGAMLAAPMAIFVPGISASAAVATPVISVVSSTTWTDTGRVRTIHVVGEVRNDDASRNASSIQVYCQLLDAASTMLKDQTYPADAEVLKPGEKSPFELIFDPQPFDHATCTASAAATPAQPNRNVSGQILSVGAVDPGSGAQLITVKVTNNNTIAVSKANLFITLYRSATDQTTIGRETLYLNGGGSVPPGDSVFTITHYDPPWAGDPAAAALLVETPSPLATVTPSVVTLTQVRTRSIQSTPITLTNTGTAELHVGQLSISGPAAADWTEVDTCSNTTILSPGSCTITATFTPSATGPRNATLTIPHDANNNPAHVALNGTGTDPVAVPTPSPMAFADQALNTTSAPPQTLTVSNGNPGVGPLHISTVQISGTNASDFRIAPGTDQCTGAVVAHGIGCTVGITFTPGAAGPRGATLTVTDDALTSPQTVLLSGTGVTSTVAFDSPTKQYSFGNQQFHVKSAPVVVTVKNNGASRLDVTRVCLSNTAEFSLDTSGCSAPFSLAQGAQKSIPVTMTAGGTGTRSTTMQFFDNAPDNPQFVTLTGTGTFGGQFNPITPLRIYDTRDGAGPLGSGLDGSPPRDVPVLALANAALAAASLPPMPSNATAVVMNVTVDRTTAASALTLYPTGAPSRPIASNLNWVRGQTVPNLVEVGLGTGGQVTVFNGLGQADVIFDLAGYVTPESNPPAAAGFFNPIIPTRVLDTRNNVGVPTGPVTEATRIDVQIAGAGSGLIPPNGVAAVVLNLTVTNATAHDSFVSVYPAGQQVPNISNVNFVAGQTVPNRVVVQVGRGGMVSFYNAKGQVDMIADVAGWFTDTSASGTGAGYNPVTPARILDTRDGTGGFSTQLGQTPIALDIAGAKNPAGELIVPAGGPAATAVVLNVTVTNPVTDAGGSVLTVWPNDVGKPGISDLNFKANQTIPNLVVVKVGADGKIAIANAVGTTDVVVDIVGWYS